MVGIRHGPRSRSEDTGALGEHVRLELSLMPPGVEGQGHVAFDVVRQLRVHLPDETNNTGIGTPFTVRQLPPRAVGSGIWFEAWFVGLRSCPKMLTKPPGASGKV
jgi:hypothetical protein